MPEPMGPTPASEAVLARLRAEMPLPAAGKATSAATPRVPRSRGEPERLHAAPGTEQHTTPHRLLSPSRS